MRHPSEWRWCGYDELMGRRCRYRIVSTERLLESLGGIELDEFRAMYDAGVRERVEREVRGRESHWTESLAVGSQEFIERMRSRYQRRSEVEVKTAQGALADGAWTIRESKAPYVAFSGAKRGPKQL